MARCIAVQIRRGRSLEMIFRHCFAEEFLGGIHAAIRTQQRSDGLTLLVYRSIQIVQRREKGNWRRGWDSNPRSS